ncbi:MAG: amidase, hydantoinase/carbamoylase family, partial [Clostridia bacterium]|nr:amidase, hydantoinase/carbamoylase family [Clostridia bacterium]
ELVSMAGHDAANMQRVTQSGMIFVQSIDGKSHCPSEKTHIKDIEKVGNAMLEALLILDRELN